LCEIDLSQLIGGDAFTFSCTISNNGLGIKTSALIDTGANGFVFIDTEFAKTACQFLSLERYLLATPCNVRGFDGQRADPITDYLVATLIVDGRRQLKVPMLVVKLRGQDLILGRRWAANLDVLIDCKNRRLIWPDDQRRNPDWGRVISARKEDLIPKAPNPAHQQDADRRNRLMEKETWRPKAILKRTPNTWKTDQQDRYRAMDTELGGRRPERQTVKTERAKGDRNWKPTFDICSITAEAFRLNMRQPNNVVFATSIYEIDCILQDREHQVVELSEIDQQPDETELQWLKRILPGEFRDCADVFSKEASNVLPPHRSYDHKIQIDNPEKLGSLGYSPLYH